MPLVLPGEEVSLNEPGRTFPRHHHLCGYAALLVKGSCEEAGDCGRFGAVAGDVLIHRPFDGHGDCIGIRGAVIINVHLSQPLRAAFGRVADLDAVVRGFEHDKREGEDMLRQQFVPRIDHMDDWPDLLAQDLASDTWGRLDDWACSNGLHPASLSRGFRLAYAVTPRRYRYEQMAARAARLIVGSEDSLSAVAADCGFADQAHMTRALVNLFGRTPARLRRLR